MDPKPTVGISVYVAFNNNPVFNSDPLGDTTLPALGNYNTSVELPDNATFEKYSYTGGYTVQGKSAPTKGAVEELHNK